MGPTSCSSAARGGGGSLSCEGLALRLRLRHRQRSGNGGHETGEFSRNSIPAASEGKGVWVVVVVGPLLGIMPAGTTGDTSVLPRGGEEGGEEQEDEYGGSGFPCDPVATRRNEGEGGIPSVGGSGDEVRMVEGYSCGSLWRSLRRCDGGEWLGEARCTCSFSSLLGGKMEFQSDALWAIARVDPPSIAFR